MKQLLISTALFLSVAGTSAQTSGIDTVLRQIEANNKELQANAQLISSQNNKRCGSQAPLQKQ